MAKKQENEFENEDTLTIYLDNDEKLECYVVNIFEAGGQEYIALLPKAGQEYDEGLVYIYRIDGEDENGDPILQNITSDEEWEIASEKFDELLDSMEYDEIVDGMESDA